MFIQITPKKLDKNYAISATFEHDGVPYEERFNARKSFLSKIARSKDRFVCAVDYTDMSVIYPATLNEYKNKLKH